MFRPRVIPVLLLKNNGLVKSIKFKDHKYIGDPINAVRIFNDLQADELVFLDITASEQNRTIPLEFVKEVGEEANMPFVVGGGIRSLHTIQDILKAGAEKVIINKYALENFEFVKEAVAEFGSSTISVCIDIKKSFLGKYAILPSNKRVKRAIAPIDYAKKLESLGAGELIVQSIDRDGTMMGYDLPLIVEFSKSVTIPIIALGGAGTNNDLEDGYNKAYANGLAAGSLFVYQSKKRGVLINYPKISDLSI